jgi:hypothetical protein
MYKFELLENDDNTPLGKNTLNSKAIFYQRSKYIDYNIKNTITELMESRKDNSILYGFIDINTDGKNYGKINLNNEYVVLDLTNTSNNFSKLVGNNIIKGPDFVLNQAFKFIEEYNIFLSTKNAQNSPFKTLAIRSMFVNHQTEYILSQEPLIEKFNTILNLEEIRRKVVTEIDLFKLVSDNMKLYVTKTPVTKIGFVASKLYHESKTGMCINTLQNADNSDDRIKYDQFISDPFFTLYVDILRQRGFVLDSNSPWRFFIDFNNEYTMQELKKYSINSIEELFKERYIRADKNDINNLIDYILRFYLAFSSKIKVNTKLENCSGNPKISFFKSNIKTINRQQFIYSIGYINIIKLYLDLRLLENNIKIEEVLYNKIINRFIEIKTYKTEDEAIFFLNDTLRGLTG